MWRILLLTLRPNTWGKIILKLIYTYNSKVNKNPYTQKVYKELYIGSIIKANELGYYTEIYSDVDWFIPYVNKWHTVVHDSSLLWDSYKFIPLSRRKDDFLLIDGDVILMSKLPSLDKSGIYFDVYEENNWNLLYKDTVTTLSNLGIGKVIPEWSTDPIKVMNCGILKFNNINFKTLYVDRWTKYNRFITEHKNEVNIYTCTPVGAQFLLTLLVNYYNITSEKISLKLGSANPYYHHLAGKEKLRSCSNTLI